MKQSLPDSQIEIKAKFIHNSKDRLDACDNLDVWCIDE
jgi:hypothetical protein